MLMGGLYDHVGGGFFRYTTDERWQVPHFEKMLYDSAQMVGFMTGIWQFNRNELCRQRVADTVEWMLREMKQGDAFAAGLDADSEGEEGKYYLWSEPEVDAALAGTFSARFKQVYGVTRDGTAMGKNVLRRWASLPRSHRRRRSAIGQAAWIASHGARQNAYGRSGRIRSSPTGTALPSVTIAQAGAVFERPDWVAGRYRSL